MPATIGSRGNIQPPQPPKSVGPPILPAPKPVKPAPTARSLALANRVTAPEATVPAKPSVSARNYPALVNRVNVAASKVPSYYEAVRATFLHQPTTGQAQILKGIQAGKADRETTRAISDALKSMPDNQRHALSVRMVDQSSSGLGFLHGVLHAIDPATLFQGTSNQGVGGPAAGIPAGSAAIGNRTLAGAKTFEQVLKNTAKDAVNYGPGTVEGVYGLGQQVLQGHEGNALKMLTDPYVRFFEHPGKTFVADPLTSAMLFGGPETALGRGGGAVLRSGVFGDAAKAAASTAREPLRLGPDIAGAPTKLTEERSYSPNLITKGLQVANENRLRAKGLDPNVARPKPGFVPKVLANSLNLGLEAKTRRIGDEMAMVRTTGGREDRAAETTKIRGLRPHKDVQNIVSHIMQRVIRTRETAPEDIANEITRLRANDKGLRSVETLFNRRQVRDLSKAAGSPHLLDSAFEIADKLSEKVHAATALAVHYGLLDPEQALRSGLMPYAMVHMGATYDHERGLVVPDGRGGTRPLHTNEIMDHLAGWRHVDLPNPEHAEAQGARNEASIKHNESLAKAYAAAQEHRDATAEHETARNEFQANASGEPTSAESRLLKLVQALRDRPGTPGEGAAAQSRLDAIWARIRARTGGIPRDRLTAAEERLRQALAGRARTHRAAGQTGAALRDAERTLRRTPATVKQRLMVGEQVPHPAYVGHYPGKVAPHQFYQAYRMARGTLRGQKRTLETFRKGAYDHTYEGLIAQAARNAEAVTKAGFHDRIINRAGIGKPSVLFTKGDRTENGYFTADEAQRMADSMNREDFMNTVPGAQHMTPMVAFGARTPLMSVRHLQSPMDLEHIAGHERDALQAAVDAAVTQGRNGDKARNTVLIPTALHDQLKQQFKPASGGMRKLGQVTQQFRRTVLPYSTHWMTQIGTEAFVRSLVAGTLDPRNVAAGHQLMHALQDTPEGRNALREMVNATFYNKHDPLAKYNPDASPTMEALRHSPAGLVMAAHNRYANFVGAAMGRLEHEARIMGLGKIARKQLQEFTGSYQAGVKLQGENVARLASELKTNPALVAKFGRQIDDMFGKYNKLSPTVRGAVQSVAPFLPWYLNAAKFVLWNLPVKHPVASSLLASLRQTMAQDVADGKKQPLNAFQTYALSRFTPFGIYPQESKVGSLASDFTDPILPQVSGAYNVLRGDNVFGDARLTGPHGEVQPGSNDTVLPAINAGIEALLPGLSQAQVARQHGGTPYGTSTLLNPQIKPGTGGDLGHVLNHIFNPLHAFESAGKLHSKQTGAAPWWATGSSAPWWQN